ncbi:MAG: homoserine O-acetyltransferase [Balneolaceae bacterium]
MNEGITKTKLKEPFITESGHRIEQADAAYKTWGELNETRDNAILICHALTGHAAADEWFWGFFAPSGIFNPERNFVICINVPGSCYGSVGPWSENPKSGKPYRNDFPELTIRDLVRFQQLLLDQLDIRGIEFVIGGSLGGMQALEFAIMDKRARAAVCIAMGKEHTPWAIGISHTQRRASAADPKWNGGNYEYSSQPEKGLSAARMMAMITYRSPADFERKFSRKLQGESDQFQIESYLDYQGKKLVNRFDAHSYINLTKAMDSHDVARGRGSDEYVLNRVKIPVLVVGVDSDLLYPVEEQKELAKLLPNGLYREISSYHGHDAFLIEFEQLNKIIRQFTKKTNSAIKQKI